MSDINEVTMMFFFAGDNPLSPSMVSELKAIKDAGHQKNTRVLAYFDPNELGTPTRIFDVNRKRKNTSHSQIGDGRDPYVRNMKEDDVQPDEIDASKGEMSGAMKDGLKHPEALDVEKALRHFLGFCQETHPAKHYMLFLVGHGMIVGNDTFLPDDNPVSALSLEQLRNLLQEFSDKVKNQPGEHKGQFELLALHSCSMSSIEVAYQLKGTANYMMASQGSAFVGSWPYRQLLKKAFNMVEEAKENNAAVDIKELVSKLYYLSLHNATDFMLAGYSADLSLCDLQKSNVKRIDEPLRNLGQSLKRALLSARGQQLILLAHWKSQSYWQENYTDVFDFCKCLSEACEMDLKEGRGGEEGELQKALIDHCQEVMRAIDALVLHSDHFGTKYQYSHGLSIYFPWSRPFEDEKNGVLGRYAAYDFTTEFKDATGDHSWLSFLNYYFDETQRASRDEEDGVNKFNDPQFQAAREFDNPIGVLSNTPAFLLPDDPDKPSPIIGVGCSCPSIKNYPKENKEVQGREVRNVRAFSISQGALKAFD
jgi:hypothetical protein